MPAVHDTARLIGDQLVKKGILTQVQLKQAIEKQRLSGHMLGDVLIEMKYVTEDQVVEALSEQLGIPFIDASSYQVDPKVVSLFPTDFLREQLILPLFRVDKTITVAMGDPMNIRMTDRLRFLSHCEIEPLFATKSALKKAIEKHFGSVGSLEKVIRDIKVQEDVAKPTAAQQGQGMTAKKLSPGGSAGFQQGTSQSSNEQLTSLVAAAENAPIVKLVDTIIKQAVDNRSSDIHFEPEEKESYLRFRIDGVLYDVPPPPKNMEMAIISRIKIMANMDIAERRLPQDGRIQMKMENKEVDLRVSTFPTIYGENIAIRVLDKSAIQLNLEQLGFDEALLTGFQKMLDRPHGILLVTGPTGSGKTTTLYAALRTVNAVDKNIITLEDPVEYRIPRIRQSQVDVKAGLTFANGLRSILRQDPDIVLIGEIRDLETAEIAIHAALTGHLVFSTLHTNDAPSALTRLADMGVEPFLAASSIVGSLAQRLVRVLCLQCKEAFQASPEVLKSLGLDPKRELTLYKPKGCDECKQTGYRGRTGLYELMQTSNSLRDLLLKKSTANELRAQAIQEGMKTLRQSGVEKIIKGMTSVEEVLRVSEFDFGA